MVVVAMVTMKLYIFFFLSNCNETSQELSMGYIFVHLGLEMFKMCTCFKWLSKKCSFNYEFQNIKYQVGFGLSLAEFVWETL